MSLNDAAFEALTRIAFGRFTLKIKPLNEHQPPNVGAFTTLILLGRPSGKLQA